jgi:cytochrome b561
MKNRQNGTHAHLGQGTMAVVFHRSAWPAISAASPPSSPEKKETKLLHTLHLLLH